MNLVIFLGCPTPILWGGEGGREERQNSPEKSGGAGIGRKTPALGGRCLFSSPGSNSDHDDLTGEDDHHHRPLRLSPICTENLKCIPLTSRTKDRDYPPFAAEEIDSERLPSLVRVLQLGATKGRFEPRSDSIVTLVP